MGLALQRASQGCQTRLHEREGWPLKALRPANENHGNWDEKRLLRLAGCRS